MVELEPYNAAWPTEFGREAQRIADAVGNAVEAIEHIGSTAVPTLAAKPIIDLAAKTVAGVDPFQLSEPLAPLGYRQHTAGPKTHAVYVRAHRDRRTHIIHVFTPDQWAHCNQRLFRDKLLQDADARRRYQSLKIRLAASDASDYTAGKSALIQELLNEERAVRGLPPITPWDK
ncbi:GrpB family protein [Microbacterium kunmingense]|uniref:GrpB family protein n=1 Tax=Microbacterium kunmingense TaxID=2915939 RepID=UPI003D723C75